MLNTRIGLLLCDRVGNIVSVLSSIVKIWYTGASCYDLWLFSLCAV